ncbi:hypothetical protein EON65_47300 [archaeon]|nr:MAG: hypothetical protein EON65_47300 [archaeon]
MKLTAYLERLIDNELKEVVSIFTPREPHRRGCQLSLVFKSRENELLNVDEILAVLKKRGVICDARKPNVLRIAPTPLYNSFSDVYHFVHILKDVLAVYMH